MKKRVSAVCAAFILGSVSYVAAGNDAQTLAESFKNGVPSGQIRLGYILLDPDEGGATYDLALGGQLKFETAPLYGVSLGAALYTSHSLLQPDDQDFNDEMSSAEQHYDLLGEAYIHYALDGFSLRVGRQLIDTPFADSDDIRMTPHTFETVLAGYEFNDFLVQGGYLSTCQGVDAGYHDNADFEEMFPGSDGTWLLGTGYGTDILETSFWYYHVADVVDAFYADVAVPIEITDNISVTVGAQITLQSDDTNEETSADIGSRVEGNLYGVMTEVSFSGLTLGAAYNHASLDEGEVLFGGFGGGPFFTNIDTLVANDFAAGQDADSYILSLGFDMSELGLNGLTIGYTYGNYQGGSEAMDSTADMDVDEHDFYMEYAISETWSVDAVYVLSDDQAHQETSEWDYERAQVRVNLTF